MLFLFPLKTFPFSNAGQAEGGQQWRGSLPRVQSAGDRSHKAKVPVAITVSNGQQKRSFPCSSLPQTCYDSSNPAGFFSLHCNSQCLVRFSVPDTMPHKTRSSLCVQLRLQSHHSFLVMNTESLVTNWKLKVFMWLSCHVSCHNNQSLEIIPLIIVFSSYW